MQILDHLSRGEQGATLAELSRSLSAPKTSLLVTLRALVATGYVAQTGPRYMLGDGFRVLAQRVVAGRSPFAAAKPILEEIVNLTGETAIISTLTSARDEIVHVEKAESRNALRFAVAVGDRRPLYCTAAGIVLLSHFPPEEVERYLRQVRLNPLASKTISSKAALRRRIRAAAQADICVSIDQSVEGVTGIAAPIRDGSRRVVASLILAAPSIRVEFRSAELCQQARLFSCRISEVLG